MSTAAGVSAVLLPRGISFFGNTAPIDPDAAGPFPNDFDRNLIWASRETSGVAGIQRSAVAVAECDP